MPRIRLITVLLILLLPNSCGGLKADQKDQIKKLIAQCRSEMEVYRVTDTAFTNNGFDLTEEFPADLLNQNLQNIHAATEDLKSGSYLGFSRKMNTGLAEKLNRQNKLNTMKIHRITSANEVFGKYYLEILGVVKGSPVAGKNEALRFSVDKRIPDDWHELTRAYIQIQDKAIETAYSPVTKTAGARDQINGNLDINHAFLDKVGEKISK